VIQESVPQPARNESKDLLTTAQTEEDSQEFSLRPQSLSEFLGQNELKSRLAVFIQAANQRQEALDHVLLSGPPGLGKTTFSRIIASELRAHCHVTSGPAIERPGDLAAILTNLQSRDVLFIDEIHRLRTVVEEILYSAMEDYKLDIIVGKGPDARTLRIDLPRFTLIGATTRSGLLSSPLRDRFGILGHFEHYPVQQLASIVRRSADLLQTEVTQDGAEMIARRSRGTPRIVNRLLRRVRDFAQVDSQAVVDGRFAAESLDRLQVDSMGLDHLDLRILNVLGKIHSGNAIGLNTLAISVGEEEETIAEVCEPYLIQIGFLERTPRGRRITVQGQKYLNDKVG